MHIIYIPKYVRVGFQSYQPKMTISDQRIEMPVMLLNFDKLSAVKRSFFPIWQLTRYGRLFYQRHVIININERTAYMIVRGWVCWLLTRHRIAAWCYYYSVRVLPRSSQLINELYSVIDCSYALPLDRLLWS